MGDSVVAKIRAFNRFYTAQIGLLNERVAKSRFSLAEGRLLYEIGKRKKTTARELSMALAIDPAYLSRLLQAASFMELVVISPSQVDRRSNEIVLSAAGQRAVDELETLNDDAIEKLLGDIGPDRRLKLVEAMGTIRSVFGDDAHKSPVVLRPHRIGDLGWMIHRQGILYNRQFGWNGEFEALIARIYGGYETLPGPKDLWVAEQNGGIVGSIFVAPSEGLADSAQLRMLYVEPSARGQGVGTVLVAQAVGFARANTYKRMRLWTHTIQESARRIYAAAGFAIVETIPEDNFGIKMMGEIWEMVF